MSGAWQYGYFPAGCRAHVVQVGLGDNRTFLHDWFESPPELRWLLSSISSHHDFCGVAVEPVWRHLEAAYHLAESAGYASNVALIQAALGQQLGRTAIYRVEELPPEELKGFSEAELEEYELQMSYLRNMSCVEELSDWLQYRHHLLEEQLKVHVPITQDVVPLWTWQRLVEETGFVGCEVLLIDAEGFDVEILRSLAEYCADRVEELPWVIQFESNGLCNARAGYDCEREIVTEFEKLGYLLLGRGRDTYMVLKSAWSTSLQEWLSSWTCVECDAKNSYPYALMPEVLCQSCADCVWKKRSSESSDDSCETTLT
mgnify:FL=1